MIYTDILAYLQVIRRRWWIIAILFAATMAVIILGQVTAKPVYRAQVRLQVLAAERQEVYLFSAFRSSGLTDEVKAAQSDFVRQLTSPYVAQLTAADLGLGISPFDLVSRLSVSTDGDFVTLVVEADNPEHAEGIATRQAENALVQFRKTRSLPSASFLTFVTDQLKLEEDGMLRAEEALVTFKREHALEDLSRELVAYQDSIRSLKQQADQAASQQQLLLARAGKEREQAQSLLTQAAGLSSSPYTAQTLREQAARFTSQAADHELEAAVQGTTVEETTKLITKRQGDMQSLLGLTANFAALKRTLDQASGNYSFLVGKANEAQLKLAQAQNLGFIQVVEGASRPTRPAPNKFSKLAVVAAVVSILAGIILVFVLEFAESLRKRIGPDWLSRSR